MNTDIRLSVGFWQHPKTKKTAKRLGLEGVRSLQVLWLWAAINRPNGVLSGMDWEDIELAADWQGEDRAFFEICLGSESSPMWIDEVEGGYILHDWAEHNPWQAEAKERSDTARNNAKSGWEKRKKANQQTSGDAGAMPDGCNRNAAAMQPHDSGNAPSPSPSPKPEEKNTNTQGTAGNNNRARALECSSGDGVKDPPPGTRFDSDPGIEFQELRAEFDERIRVEGPLTGFTEYKQLWASNAWPGIDVLSDAIDAWAKAYPTEADKAYVPSLARFLREHIWKQKPKARASPAAMTFQEKAEADMWAKVDQAVKGGG